MLNIIVSSISSVLIEFGYYYGCIKTKLAVGSRDMRRGAFPHFGRLTSTYLMMLRHSICFSRVNRADGQGVGRKYGVTMLLVSQRPTEISDTIISQCNNFLALMFANLYRMATSHDCSTSARLVA